MTKLEYVLTKQGDARTRCIYAAFNCDAINAETIAKHYDLAYNEFPFPHVCLDIIKAEYGKRINNLNKGFIIKLICDMMQTHCNASDFMADITECVENFMIN